MLLREVFLMIAILKQLQLGRANYLHELNLKPGNALWWGKPAHLLQPYNKLAPKPHLRFALLFEEEQKGLL